MKITAWADGFGLWHARVPLSNDPKSDKILARAAIAWHLNDSGPPIRVKLSALPLTLVSTDFETLTAEYKELS